MIVELISTGSELLLGDTVNTNVSWLAQELNKLGYTIAYQSVVGDNPKRMAEVFQNAAHRADIVISTGGLGPTQGDITRNVLADSIGRPVVFSSEAMAEVQDFFKRVNRAIPDASRREAQLPEGAEVLHNPVGVAPGVVVEDGDTTYFLLPGPPGEMKGMFQESVIPYLERRFGSQGVVTSYRYGVYDIREIDLEKTLMDLIQSQSNPTIALLIKKGYIEVRITAKAETMEKAQLLLNPWDAIIRERLGNRIGRNLSVSMEETLGKTLLDEEATISTAESCTAGLVGKLLTNVSGSSEYYMGGIISYSNDVKHRVLGVPEGMLNTYGAVSEEVAKAMAEGARSVGQTTYAVSITGIAGPGGGSPEKPVGLVWFGISGPYGTVAHKANLIGNREDIRQSAAELALYYAYIYITEKGK
ncbi:competence/damage-inducible protein A [Veillonella denticariosi JCM 15641]|uniref:Putative competence-damage inducible protein n=1 Tax=Veillonella denticariosi JCM 15641 TaxID=1298594 RepID=A0A2S7Z813_9FIRM|nr:competence/damage-inducible protein A [Veillonella denticariosi]PQL19369.1 competence/damage-inducible protein A [Veillonella denticariosi JCM 15641]